MNNLIYKLIKSFKMKKIFIRELHVPTDAIAEVATVLTEKELTNRITDSDEDEEMITLEVEYEKDEKEAIREIIEIINQYDSNANSDEAEN